MTFLCILSAVLLDRMLPGLQRYRQFDWLADYHQRLSALLPANWQADDARMMLALLLPPALLVLLLASLMQALFGLSGSFLFASLMLYLSLGPKDISRQIETCWHPDGLQTAGEHHKVQQELLMDEPPVNEQQIEPAIADALLWQANNRFFAPLLWFVLLGPLGAVIYRLVNEQVMAASQGRLHGLALRKTSLRLLDILDWLPARLSGLCYALAGSLEDALSAWRDSLQNERQRSPRQLLTAIGRGALKLDDDESNRIDNSMTLLWRAGFFLLSGLGLLALIMVLA
ncbi:MAG: regulatory signaling modulator protein AmpE [gamma proteobacterium symbiont of Bathyaustriella thionipta]|nr:regulatory signaling modulator protein AmpE [gamma proteobacterium symbiont of Bathyaustriella thionipta]